jgi:hypothetical protein
MDPYIFSMVLGSIKSCWIDATPSDLHFEKRTRNIVELDRGLER